jgi:2-polyprenyl-3-methyl-5-hydroxy-6-metoxy-1,4-benzoquinol methylase
MSDQDQIILSHYARLAKNYGLSSTSSMKDSYIREIETKFICDEVQRHVKSLAINGSKEDPVHAILEVGCGNGHLLSCLHSLGEQMGVKLSLSGIEFTPELLELAQARNLPEVQLLQGDIRRPLFTEGPFEAVISERVLINILQKKDQNQAMANIVAAMSSGAILILVESFQESLEQLNRARKEMKLVEITPNSHNLFLREDQMHSLLQLGMQEISGIVPPNFLSTHFYLTRVLHPIIRPEKGKVENTEFLHFFRQALPPSIGNYSPIQMRVFKKL